VVDWEVRRAEVEVLVLEVVPLRVKVDLLGGSVSLLMVRERWWGTHPRVRRWARSEEVMKSWR
jgi:hypothetical protein